MTTALSVTQKQISECTLSICKVPSQSILKKKHNASLNVTTLFVYKLLQTASASIGATLSSGTVVQEGLSEQVMSIYIQAWMNFEPIKYSEGSRSPKYY